MDLRFKYRNNIWIWIILVASLFCSVTNSWRITQKCPHGHYYNDGCTACWCDTRTGLTKCERLLQCASSSHVICPLGRHYKDDCGNDCTCYPSTGAVFCNEKRKCSPVVTAPPANNAFQRRDGLVVADDELYRIVTTPVPPTLQFNSFKSNPYDQMSMASSSTPTSTNFFNSPNPILPNNFFNQFAVSSTPTSAGFLNTPEASSNSLFEKISISSTPHPQVRIPNRSEELIIEPAIIIRKKGSNKASVVRNPSSATSVTLSSRHGTSISSPTQRTSTILLNPNNKPVSFLQNSTPRPVAPLHLYEKQLKTIMNIKRAYANLLRSKLNVNNLLSPSKVASNLPFERIVVLQENSNPNPSSTSEHPRRFDSSFANTTFINTTPSSVFSTSQQPKPPLQSTYQTFWKKPEIIRKELKNALKHFSPVPHLNQLVSYVTTSTESYLSQFLNVGNKQSQQQQQKVSDSTNLNYMPSAIATNAPTTPAASLNNNPNPWLQQASSVSYHHEMGQFDPSTTPIHQVYQNHDYSAAMLTTTPAPPSPPSLPPPINYQTSFQSKMDYYPNQFAKKDSNPPRFPYMTELMHEIARVDHFPPPSRSTPRTSPALTAVPTFQTPGPPYAEVDVVRPLSFLPPPKPEPATPTHRSYTVRAPPPPPPPRQYHHHHPPRPTVRYNMDKPIFLPPPAPPPVHSNRRNFVKPPPFQIHRQFIIPRPKQYRLVLKGGMREAAVKVDDVVPRFVSRIAHEFFKKPEIYVPKIRPGKPLTLEKVVLNHKQMIPKEVVFHPGTSPTKLRFTPQAHWEMKSDLAKHGIMLDEPLNPVRDYGPNDPNVMEMDSPVHAIQTFEKHTNMHFGNVPEYSHNTGINMGVPPTSINDKIRYPPIQHQQQPIHQEQFPILHPSPTPTLTAPSIDHQHQQEIQHQLHLAQQQINGDNTFVSPAASGSNPVNDFAFNPDDMDDFKQESEEDVLPHELQIPGVQQVVVDKFIVHDPLSPSGGPLVFSTTTVDPPTQNHDMYFNNRRSGVGMRPPYHDPGPTPPAVLIRHHGAPSPSTTSSPSLPLYNPQRSNSGQNFMFTVISSTPAPFVTTTASPPPSQAIHPSITPALVDQIQDFLANQMDFGAKPQTDLFDMAFHSRAGSPSELLQHQNPIPEYPTTGIGEVESTRDALAVEDQVANEAKLPGEIETDGVADIFSMDYKQKYGKKPPEVIVIKVPEGHSDGPFPKVVEKRRGQEIEIMGAALPKDQDDDDGPKSHPHGKETVITSTENSIISHTTKSTESSSDASTESSGSKRRRRKKNKKRKRKKKRKNGNGRDRDENVDKSEKEDEGSDENDNDSTTAPTSEREKTAEEKFQSEIDWKSQLMANICELNPSSPLCLTYRSICLLMTSD